MKQLLISIIAIFAISACGQNNKETQNILSEIIQHTEEASLYREQVNWDTLRPNIYKLAKDAQTVADLKPALTYMLASIKDEHGRIFLNNKILANYNSSSHKDHHHSLQSDIYNNIQMAQVYDFHAVKLERDIGYVRIVGLPPMGDMEQMALDIQSQVCRLIEDGVDRWIIDLRYNGGGNMHPMAEGIALIIGNGIVGGAKGLTENENSIWKIDNDDFNYDEYSIALEDNCSIQKEVLPKVAVLTSVYTASSGEAIAVIFKGRNNTKFFGHKTLGMVTVTDWNVINDSTSMTISVSHYQDRNGNIYDQFVDVDQEEDFVEEPLSESDHCLKSAIKWLLKTND